MKKTIFSLILTLLLVFTPVIALSATVDTLVQAGGGGGGTGAGAGGGGGGYQADTTFVVTEQEYTITVGAGGPGGIYGNDPNSGADGNDSVFDSITGNGGGGGGSRDRGDHVGRDGGSGGGGASTVITVVIQGGTGDQGFDGGDGIHMPGGNGLIGGGGGGASEAGGDFDDTIPRNGGDGGEGISNSISGSAEIYGSGAGGCIQDVHNDQALAGDGGTNAGDGGLYHTGSVRREPTAGTANFGGGGGAHPTDGAGKAGGSGIIIIAFATDGSDGVSPDSTFTGASNTKTTSGANTIYTFNESGTWTMVAAEEEEDYNNSQWILAPMHKLVRSLIGLLHFKV